MATPISTRTAGTALAFTLALGYSFVESVAAQEPTSPGETATLTGLTDSPLVALRRGRDAFIGIRDFNAALNPAEAIVDAQREQREPEYAADLATLGRIQGELRNTDQAVTNLVEAIDLVETAEGQYSPTLIEYYRGLGRAYIRGGQYQEALVSLEEAQHISQRHLGLFNVEQSPLLDDITTAYLGLGDTVEAQRIQVERLDNALRRFGAADPRIIPFRFTLGKYYEQSRLPESARAQYTEVLKSQETRLGSNDVQLLAPLRELVAIDLLVTQTADTTQRDRLAALLEQNPGADPADRGLSLALLGDWATVAGDTTAARGYYRESWNALSAAPNFDVAGAFAKPVMIDFVVPLSPVDRAERKRPYTWAPIVLEFDVSADGLPADVRAITRNGETAVMQGRYSRRLRETHFRPRLIDGEPVATTNVRSTHYVRRYVSRDEEEAAE